MSTIKRRLHETSSWVSARRVASVDGWTSLVRRNLRVDVVVSFLQVRRGARRSERCAIHVKYLSQTSRVILMSGRV